MPSAAVAEGALADISATYRHALLATLPRVVDSIGGFVVASIYVMPIRTGQRDEFQAFVAELMGPRRVEWAQSHRRRGVKRQVVFLGKDGNRDLAMVYSESNDPEGAIRAIAASEYPFDKWLAGKMSELLEARIAVDTLADTAPKPGPWRGWRRWR